MIRLAAICAAAPFAAVATLSLTLLVAHPAEWPLVTGALILTALGAAVGLALWLHTSRFIASACRMLDAMPGTNVGNLPRTPVKELQYLAHTYSNMALRWTARHQSLTKDAYTDALTGLENRNSFTRSLTKVLERVDGNECVALLFLDLDGFKQVNDNLGHAVGDELLRAVARRLQQVAESVTMKERKGNVRVGRLGGDEFTMLVSGLDVEQRAVKIAEDVLAASTKPVNLDGHELFANVSIGIAFAFQQMPTTELLRRADIALYSAKAAGKGRHAIYRAPLNEPDIDQVALESGLRRAVERGELEMAFQPEIDLMTGHTVGMEALLRWNHPHLGRLSPESFIELAEESGELTRIGQWVLHAACRELAALKRSHAVASNMVVGVNLSAAEFLGPDLLSTVRSALRESALRPESLRIELTETILVENLGVAARVIASLRALGVEVAIDDFGTGYASLKYLQSLPINVLKIDKSFVDGLGKDERSNAIVLSMLELGRKLRLEVVAEGIEVRDQALTLRRAGCTRGQGYLFAKPLARAELDQYLFDEQKRRDARVA
ncbi:MAG: putative bifunctional diguanylate cyclase/phosphodiesterase [Dehalococcoidia bacterium]